MSMKRKVMMRLIVGLAVVICIAGGMLACCSQDGYHLCTYGANFTETVGTSAKCTATYHTCTTCGKKAVVSSTEHDYDVSEPQIIYKDEQATGYQQTSTCKVCEYVYTRLLSDGEIYDAGLPSIEELNTVHIWEQTETAATKADYENYLSGIGSTDTVPVDEGYIATYYTLVRSCSLCDKVETIVQRRDVPDPNYKPDNTTPTQPLPDNNKGDKTCTHTYISKPMSPTCTSKGYTEYVCNKCGDSYTSNYVNATGHAFSVTSTKNATCTASGSKAYSCKTCGKNKTETLQPTGHSYGDWSTTKAATCDTNGTKARNCKNCTHSETGSIAATGHAWDDGKITVVPTSCDAMGIKTYTCKTCSKTKTEQIKGSHSLGDWEYEEYTYDREGTKIVSHHQVRKCTKCSYKEADNTPNHSCRLGALCHEVTTLVPGTCTTKAIMRSTCTICGWHTDYNGSKASHTWTSETRHLSDYGPYTNELDVEIDTCTVCSLRSVLYIYGEGFKNTNKYYIDISIDPGTAFAGRPGGEAFLEHPTWQMVYRDYKYDADGYVTQFTVYWHDKNGKRYSDVIDCTPEYIQKWFRNAGLYGFENCTYHLTIQGSFIIPYKISWTS